MRAPKVRLEAEPEALLAFLIEHAYPHHWSLENLRDHCVRLRLDGDDGTLGYVWMHWSPDVPGAMDFHVCIARDVRWSWLSPGLVQRLFMAAELCGAHAVVTRPHGADAPRIRRLLAWIGFDETPDFMFHPIEDQPHGHVQQAQGTTSASAAAPAAASARTGD